MPWQAINSEPSEAGEQRYTFSSSLCWLAIPDGWIEELAPRQIETSLLERRFTIFVLEA
jgi:hypothetical protein